MRTDHVIMPLKHRRPGGEKKARRVEREEGGGRGGISSSSAYFTPYRVAIIAVALFTALAHSVHLHTLFENDRFFSHLSPLERELSFRTEMGLYYSYYKTVVGAPSLLSGVGRLVHDNVTEYPSTINTLRRFNLYPEVLLGAMFRGYHAVLGWLGSSGVQCFSITRGFGQPPIQTCTGLGDLSYFYVYCIFALNGLMAAGLFLLGVYLGRGLLGGLLTLSAFFFNHGEATRAMWTPPLRESFAMPFLTLETLALTHTLRHQYPSWSHALAIATSALAFLLPWQFAQFALLTQVLSLLVTYSLRLLSAHTFSLILVSIAMAFLLNVVLQFANALLLTSYLPCCLLTCMVVVFLRKLFNKLAFIPLIAGVEVAVVVVGAVAVKVLLAAVIGTQDDAHIGALLLSKVTSYQDFHTQLYTCAAEFDFLPLAYALSLTLTLLLPMACGAGGLVACAIVGRRVGGWRVQSTMDERKAEQLTTTEALPEQCYHLVQALAYGVMAVLIMRLKLFLTPQLAVLTSLLAHHKVTWFLRPHQRRWLLTLLLLASALKGGHNLYQQWSIIGEFNNPDQEALMQWVGNSTGSGAVFAGAMPTMAAIKLSTGRPIVNHPHYEDAGLRNRTKYVYTIYSRKPPTEVHSVLQGMGVKYVVVEDGWCSKQYRPGCAFSEVWDYEDTENRGRPAFCELLHHTVPAPFLLVFENKTYRVLQVQ